jgi:hypothetical protein
MYYNMLIGWTSQKIKDSYRVHNPFDFKHGMFQALKGHALFNLMQTEEKENSNS